MSGRSQSDLFVVRTLVLQLSGLKSSLQTVFITGDRSFHFIKRAIVSSAMRYTSVICEKVLGGVKRRVRDRSTQPTY
jgi:phosphopantetheine adenylyltransferase